ncbi:Fc.00g086810.m01.CDS01 [Cosmosporella sp. VM-42]
MRKPWRFYSLNRPKLRQSWNKYNLYNIARAAGREPPVKGRATFFQQKWAAKAKTRAYHGEHISEKKWVRLFSRRLNSAVDLPPEYLAANDGSEQAAGRGSGLSHSTVTAETYSRVPGGSRKTRPLTHPSQKRPGFGDSNDLLSQHFENMTPYMQMTFAPLERRLDTAVFRALFASSVRQARQFVIHGAVKVNGKKMVHPSYALNPGDMFQVDIDKVLYGTGEQKQGNQNLQLEQGIKARKKGDKEFIKAYREKQAKGAKGTPAETAPETEPTENEEGEAIEVEEDLGTDGERFVQKLRLRQLRRRAREILQGDLKNLSARQKKELRFFRDAAQRFLSRPDATKLNSQELMDELQFQIKSLYASVPAFKKTDPEAEGIQLKEETSEEKQKAAEAEKKNAQFRERVLEKGLEGIKDKKEIARARRIMEGAELTREELKRLAIILRNDMENPVDESKPYVTPWRPRAFMSAFAFIPRYLEVNPNICAAVYLRHPVARKGMAEVPTPFGYLTNQLAHNWYLGRG